MKKTAGDLLIDAVAAWMPHATTCGLSVCRTCDVLINRLRLAFKVWENSSHQTESNPAATLLQQLVIAWDADQEDEFNDAAASARALLGLKLADDAEIVLEQLQIEHADEADDDDNPEAAL